MRAATASAAALLVAAAGMAAAAFAGGEARERAAPPATPRAARPAPDGLAVWVRQGCGSCHAFGPANAKGILGPDLALGLHGMPAASIRESIVAPGAAAAAGYDAGMMPADYARRIPPADLERLVAFLQAGAGG